MARPKTRPDPDVSNPLGNATPHERLHAAYLARGMTRADFARAMGVRYQTVDRWDLGELQPDLGNFFRACELVGYDPRQVMFGGDGHAYAFERARVTDESMDADERSALDAVIQEFAETITPAFVAVYRAELAAGAESAIAAARARDVALEARTVALKRRAQAEAIALGGRPAVHFAPPKSPPTVLAPKPAPATRKPR
jgi:transcriptional regulator with XRE-family HTH domain